MKIGTDVSSYYPKTAPDVKDRVRPRTPAGAPAAGGVTDLQFIQTMTSRLQAEKSLSGALTIAVMSRNIIHKAMEVSARLRAIAAHAMVSGKIDSGEVSMAVSDINIALSNYGEGGVIPVRPATEGAPEMTDVSGNIATLRGIAADMQVGGRPDMAALDVLERGLSEGLAAADMKVNEIQDSLVQAVSRYPVDGAMVPEDYAGRVILSITGDPVSAIRAQGNISHDSAARLLMS